MPAEISPPSESTSLAHPDFFPFHVVPGISNFRDIGGWPVASPESTLEDRSVIGHVRKGILFRGSDTNRIQPDGVSKLRELGIQTDYDLRSRQQIQNTGGYKEIEGIQRRWKPVFTDEQYTEEAAKKRYELYADDGTEGIVTAFIEILTSGAPMFHDVLQDLLTTVPPRPSPVPSPALFMHCTTGNNRTGAFISLLLLLLNVPHSSVCEEYALSEQGLAPTRHINVGRLLTKGAFEEFGPEEAKRKCERMVGAREESMQALIEEVEKRWGGPEGYFKDLVALSPQDIEKLRKVMIETTVNSESV